MSAPTGPLTTLAQLILQHAEVIDAAYISSTGTPFPSLSEPQYPYDPHLLEDETEAKHSARILSSAAHQLTSCLRPAMGTLYHETSHSFFPVALGLVEEHNIADILREGPAEGMHVKKIAAQAQVADPSKLARLLRFLSSGNFFKEVKTDVFANNLLSSALVKNLPVGKLSTRPSSMYDNAPDAATISSVYNELFHCLPLFPIWFSSPANDDSNVPFEVATGKNFWEHISQNQLATRRFARSMAKYAQEEAPFYLPAFRSLNILSGTVVDVGGSTGGFCLQLARQFPDLRFTVQDLPMVIEKATESWDCEDLVLLKNGTVALQSHSFFDPQPVKGASLYVLRHILHNWSSSNSTVILKQLRGAASPSSKLVIFDAIVPTAGRDSAETSTIDQGADRNLPSMESVASGAVCARDMLMAALLGSQERTLAEFVALGESTGWKIDRVVPGGGVSALVFVPI